MSRLRVILLASLAALVVSAVGSASASASCSAEGGDPAPLYCIGNNGEFDSQIGTTGLDEGGGEPTVASTGTTIKLKTTAGSPTIECANVAGTANIFQQNSGRGLDSVESLKFTGCVVVGSSTKCSVSDTGTKKPGEINVSEIDSELVEVGGVIYNVFFNSEKREKGKFVTLEILKIGGATCIVAGNYEVTGEACGEAKEEALQVTVPLRFSKAIQTACKVKEELKLKGVNSWLEGETKQKLEGTMTAFNDLTGKLETGINVAGLKWGTTKS
jgi:hypothetical protein